MCSGSEAEICVSQALGTCRMKAASPHPAEVRRPRTPQAPQGLNRLPGSPLFRVDQNQEPVNPCVLVFVDEFHPSSSRAALRAGPRLIMAGGSPGAR